MYTLDQQTQLALQAYKEQVARVNNSQDFSAPFDVKPAVTQKLIDQYQQQTDFLKLINIVQVKDAYEQKLGLGNNQSVASTTDTRIQPRRPVPIGKIEGIDDYLHQPTMT